MTDFFAELDEAALDAERKFSETIKDDNGNQGRVFTSPGRWTYEGPAWFNDPEGTGGASLNIVPGESLNRVISAECQRFLGRSRGLTNIRVTVEIEEKSDDATTQAP